MLVFLMDMSQKLRSFSPARNRVAVLSCYTFLISPEREIEGLNILADITDIANDNLWGREYQQIENHKPRLQQANQVMAKHCPIAGGR